jgi:hypothetical protein
MSIFLTALFAIIINGHTLQIVPTLPAHTARQVTLVEWQQTDFILAHSWLAGRYFYSLQPGDQVTALYGDRERDYIVVTIIVQPYMALYTADIHPGSTYLVTCWPRLGKPIGRLIVELKPSTKTGAR